MVSVRFCCRSADGVGKETVQLPPSCLTQPVQAVRSTAAHMLGLTPSQLELVYRGRPLLDDRPLSSYELSAASVLHGFRRPADADTAAAAAPTEPADGTQLAWTLQRHTQDPVRRHAFTRLVRPETLDRLLAAVPGLEDDPIALALLQEPGLLLQVASPRTNVKRLVAAHPVLATAASQLAALLGEGSSGTERGRPGPSDSRAAPRVAEERPMEQGSFDDDDGDDEPAAAAGGAAAPPITREQLASALAAAVPNLASAAAAAPQSSGVAGSAGGQTRAPAAVRQQPAPAPAPAAAPAPMSTPAPAPAPQQQPVGVISPEMVSAALREAMRALPGAQRTPPAAQAAQPQPPPSAAAPVPQPAAPVREEAAHQSPAVDEAAVRQLLELGITDSEALVRQALLVSEGNIDHAVEFIYSSLQ
ncbi:translation initiation factor IF-2-like isoform X2 [Amphibalanus amphitrite]|uniref:translation initiation factor IF-2-like isoform X2 n=1 Tax=Amphibalanus amphitrite TaxID=1232801 RepID=UPI001C9255D6|nr:translation initiation factor IF-2-like isoform X2 [Amphibalanus amphitrite]